MTTLDPDALIAGPLSAQTLTAQALTAQALITQALIAQTEAATPRNYDPLPVVLAQGDGAWVTDVTGHRYLDCLAGYSALNFGHRHPALVAAAHAQLDRLTLTSRAFHSDRFGGFVAAVAQMCGKDMVLPMNSGAEAVETAVKVARRWAYEVKGVPADRAGVVVAAGNFHGRTISVVSFSTDPDARRGFGPFTPGFVVVPYGDAVALEAAIDETTAAVLIEPVQGEAGVIVPPAGYLAAVREVCTRRNVLLVADEIQSGLARCGPTFACDREDVVPDVYVLGKALGGGILPVSAVVADRDVLGLLRPGEHGSTFGGNPLACAVGEAVVGLLATGEYQQRSLDLGARLAKGLAPLVGQGVVEVRTVGLWAGVDIDPALGRGGSGAGRAVSEALAARGVLAKETHGSTLRLAPPLVATPDDVDLAVDALADSLAALSVAS